MGQHAKKERSCAKNANMEDPRTTMQKKRFYSTRLYFNFNYIRIIIKDFYLDLNFRIYFHLSLFIFNYLYLFVFIF